MLGHNSVAEVCAVFAQTFSEGDIAPREWFHDKFGYDPGNDSAREQQQYRDIMKLVHDCLLTDYAILLSNTSDGYLLVRTRDYGKVILRRTRCGMTALFKNAEDIAEAADVARLNSVQRKELTDTANHIASLRRLVESETKREKRDPFSNVVVVGEKTAD